MILKWYQILGFSINAIAAFYFLYQAAMHVFVYVMNKRNGHYVDFLDSRINLILGFGLSFITFMAWLALKNDQTIKLGNFILFIPIGLVLGYGLFAIFLLIASGGKWN